MKYDPEESPLLGNGNDGKMRFKGRIEVCETPGAMLINLELPPLEPDSLQLTARENSLTVAGVVWGGRERFFRTIPVPSVCLPGKTEAVLRGAILEMKVPRADPEPGYIQ